MEAPNGLIIYHYPFSPYARRVIWYLQLRGLGYAECMQPHIMPRPDLSALGVSYRRIPVMAMGRDIYCDTRLMLRKLEEQFPQGALGARGGEQRAIQRLLDRWITDGGVFTRAASSMPPSLPILQDPKFLNDRKDFVGRPWSKEAMEQGRPESIVAMRDAFDLLESTLLADGREWILKTEGPSLGDIEAIWPFDWLVDMDGALPGEIISEKQFPKVFGWIQRFRACLRRAQASGSKAVKLDGEAAAEVICGASFAESGGKIDAADPLGLALGTEVEVWPLDSGSSHHDKGRLVSLTWDEVVIATRADDKKWEAEIHVHFPRWGFRVARASASAKM
ncbi:glutathione S-transferase [Phyllosticta citriasiana]|uniref:Glutathione S-transferase n=1 Tax=Phyllosticta citriasiana TaxID=595635 RepID=A0ABR1KIH0_9PEZI